MGAADLHVHTTDGDGLDSVESLVEHAATTTGLDVIAITEHDDLVPGLRARELSARRGLPIEVVAGAEITTLQGHVVALFLEAPVRSFQRIEDTIAEVRRQGALCFVPHPMSWLTRSVGAGVLDRLMARAGEGLAPDGVELANPSPTARLFAAKARRLNAERYRLPEIGSSDAHFKEAVGSAFTSFAGSTALDLKRALASGRVAGHEAAFPSLRAVGLLRTLSLPLTGLRATPRKLGWRRTAWSFVSRYVS